MCHTHTSLLWKLVFDLDWDTFFLYIPVKYLKNETIYL